MTLTSPRVPSGGQLRAVAALFLVLAMTPIGHAQSTWTGTSSNNWTDAGNWIGGVPVSGGIAQFNSGSAHTSISLGGAAQPINTISFSAGTAAFTLGVLSSGDAFNFDPSGTITVNSGITTAQTINAAILANGLLTITNSAANTGGLVGLTLAGNMTIGANGPLTIGNGVANATMVVSGNISEVSGQPGAVIYNAVTTGASNNNNIIVSGNNS